MYEKKTIDEFNEDTFNTMVDRIVVVRYDDLGNADPFYLRFILKGGLAGPEKINNNCADEYMELISFSMRCDFYQFVITDDGALEKKRITSIVVSAGFSSLANKWVVHNIEEMKEKVYMGSSAFMGNKSNHELADELGVCASTISDYKKRIRTGRVLNQK